MVRLTRDPARLSALAQVFGRAFVHEPMMRWPLGSEGDLEERFTRCFAYFLDAALPLGLVWEAGAGDGAAVWIAPEQSEVWDGHPWSQARILLLWPTMVAAATTRSGTGLPSTTRRSRHGSWTRSRWCPNCRDAASEGR